MASTITVSSLTSVTPGSEFQLVVTINSDQPADISSADLLFRYDPAQLELISATPGSLATSSGWATVPNTSISGVVQTSQAGAVGLSGGTGELLVLSFRALAAASGTVVVDLDQQQSGGLTEGTVDYTAVDGSVSFLDAILPEISVSVAPSSVAEDGTTNLVYTFSRTGPTTDALTVDFSVTGTATEGSDYGAIGTTAVFVAGSPTATVIVDSTADGTVEDDETVILSVAAGTGYTISATSASATGTITNDDSTLAIAATNAVLNEGDSGTTAFTFTVTRSGDSSGASSADWAVTGTGANPADASDFVGGVLPSGTVSFSAGQTSQTITVNVSGDTTVENDESFLVTLSNPTNSSITTASATGTITNDDDRQVSPPPSPPSNPSEPPETSSEQPDRNTPASPVPESRNPAPEARVVSGTEPVDPITGTAERDILVPLAVGSFVLTGGLEADKFVFAISEPIGRPNAEFITDFNPNEGDVLVLSDDVFDLGRVRFKRAKNKKSLKKLLGKKVNLIYDVKKQALIVDLNGSAPGDGDGGVLAFFDGRPALSSDSFELVSNVPFL
jgi:hypothetical protein